MPPLPEIREEDASPEIKLIYADMRRRMDLPLVNLIHRYFATVPGVLPHVWSWLRDLLESGQLEAAFARLTNDLPLPAAEPLGLAGLGLSGNDLRTIKRVLEVYNRGNGLNLIALSAVRMDLHRRVHAPLNIGAVPAVAEAVPIPRLLKFAELKPELAELVATVSSLHGDLNGVIPSLYLHLANWPEFLSAACDKVMPLLKDGSIAEARQEAVAMAREEAKALVAPMQKVAQSAGFPEPVLAVLDQFTTQVIPEMLPIGLALNRAWPASRG